MLINAIFLLSLISLYLYLLFFLKDRACLAPPKAVKSLSDIVPKMIHETDRNFIEKILSQEWSKTDNPEEKSIKALQWLMGKINSYPVHTNIRKNSSSALLGLIEQDKKGLICYNMAQLYSDILYAAGVQSRIVFLQRNIFDMRDTHATVEAFINGRWVIFDPTFGVSFIDAQDRLLSSQEVKSLLFNSIQNVVNTRFYGSAGFVGRVEKYYLNILVCFNNIFVYDSAKFRSIWRYTPLRFMFYGKLYYEKLPNESVAHLEFLRKIILFSTIILPVSIILLICFIFSVL